MKNRIKATLEKIQTEYSPSVYAGAKPAYGTMIEKGLREIEDTFFDGLIPCAPSREIVRAIVEKIENEPVSAAEIDYMAEEIERLIED